MPIIELNNVSKTFKTIIKKKWLKSLFHTESEIKTVVNNISLSIKKGESVAFIGPNGAGKTTTTKIMTGLIYPSSGSINVLGYTPQQRKKEYLMKIGLVMGNKSGLNKELTAMQTFEIHKKIYKISNSDFNDRLFHLSHLLGVEDFLDRTVRKLSLGERMKLELIGAILHNPEVLFLDEPTVGLDITAKQSIRKFLRDIQRERGTTQILTSHDMDDVEQVCDRVIVINHGKIVFDDTMISLKSKYNKEKYIKFTFDNYKNDVNYFNSLGKIFEFNNNNITYHVLPAEISELITKVSQDNKVIDIEISSVPLEEIIKEIFKS